MNEVGVAAPSRAKLLIGGGIAALIAAGLLVFVILPAEFGIDVFGAGKSTGLNDLAAAGEMTELERGALREGVLTPSNEPMRTDRYQIELGPYESIEYKYTLAQGEPVVFSWRGSAPLNYDMHAHPFDGGVDLTESYSITQAQKMEGVYIAPFTGIHGWYWQNRTMDNVTLTLDAAGMFTSSTIFEGPVEQEREIAPIGQE